MKIEFLEDGAGLTVRPHGRMEATAGSDFAAAVEQRLQPTTKSVTIDLEKLDSISFGAIRALLHLARSLKGGERSLAFLGGGEVVRGHLDEAGFDSFFTFTPPFISNRGT